MASRILVALAALSLAACTSVGRDGTLTNVNPLLISVKSTAQITSEVAATTHHGATGLPILHTDRRNDIEIIRLLGTAPAGFAKAKAGETLTVKNVRVTVKHARFGRCIDLLDPLVDTGANYCTERGKGYVFGFTTDRGPNDEIGPGYSGSGAYDADGNLVGMAVALVEAPEGGLLAFYVPVQDVLKLMASR